MLRYHWQLFTIATAIALTVSFLLYNSNAFVCDEDVKVTNKISVGAESPPYSKKNYYAPKQSCVGCHEKEFREWYDSNHQLAMGDATPDMVQGDFNDVTYTHVGFDDIAKLSNGEIKTLLAHDDLVDLKIIAQGLTDASGDVLPRLQSVMTSEQNVELTRLMTHYQASTAMTKLVQNDGVSQFAKACPVRPGDTQLPFR